MFDTSVTCYVTIRILYSIQHYQKKQDHKHIIQHEKHSDSRIHELDIQRHKLLESVSFVTSKPEHKYSYEKVTLMKKSKLSNTSVTVSLHYSCIVSYFFFSPNIRLQYDT